MARNKTITVLRTTRAALNSNALAGNLLAGEPYLITDENRLAVGLSTTTYETYKKEAEGGGGGDIVNGGQSGAVSVGSTDSKATILSNNIPLLESNSATYTSDRISFKHDFISNRLYQYGFHTPNDSPYICGFYNDANSVTQPGFEYFIWNSSSAGYVAGDFQQGTPSSGGALGLYTNGYTNTRLYIAAQGNIGINTKTPTEKLHVVGNTKVVGNLDISSTATVSSWLQVLGELYLGQFTVATLPAYWPGTIAFATNGRKLGELVGAGTGCLVCCSNGQWRRLSDETTITA